MNILPAVGRATTLVGLRIATIVLRFVLMIVVTSILGVKATGVLTVVTGVLGIVPAIVGGGLNYYLAREAVGHTPEQFAAVIRDRAFATGAALLIVGVPSLCLYGSLVGPLEPVVWLTAVLAICETFALEQYLLAIAFRRARFANILVFVRSAAWVAPVTAILLMVPAWRSMETVLVGWLVGHVAALTMVAGWSRRAGMWPAFRTAAPTRWVRRTLPNAWYIYLSDLGLVGMSFGDRILISAALGISAAGVFGFYWSFANALQTVVVSAFVQPILPDLIELHRRNPLEWRRFVLRRWRQLTVVCVCGATLLGLVLVTAVDLAPAGRFPVAPLFAMLLMIAIGLRTAGEYLSSALTSAARNRSYAAANMIGSLLMVATVVPLASRLGLIGAALGLIATALATIMIRMMLIPAAPADGSGSRIGELQPSAQEPAPPAGRTTQFDLGDREAM